MAQQAAAIIAEGESQEEQLIAIAKKSLEKWQGDAARGARRDYVLQEVEKARLVVYMITRKHRHFISSVIDELIASVKEDMTPSYGVSSYDTFSGGMQQKAPVPREQRPAEGQSAAETHSGGALGTLSTEAGRETGGLDGEATLGTEPSVVTPHRRIRRERFPCRSKRHYLAVATPATHPSLPNSA